MTTLQQTEALLPKLNSQEIQQLLQRMVSEGKAEFPGIEKRRASAAVGLASFAPAFLSGLW